MKLTQTGMDVASKASSVLNYSQSCNKSLHDFNVIQEEERTPSKEKCSSILSKTVYPQYADIKQNLFMSTLSPSKDFFFDGESQTPYYRLVQQNSRTGKEVDQFTSKIRQERKGYFGEELTLKQEEEREARHVSCLPFAHQQFKYDQFDRQIQAQKAKVEFWKNAFQTQGNIRYQNHLGENYHQGSSKQRFPQPFSILPVTDSSRYGDSAQIPGYSMTQIYGKVKSSGFVSRSQQTNYKGQEASVGMSFGGQQDYCKTNSAIQIARKENQQLNYGKSFRQHQHQKNYRSKQLSGILENELGSFADFTNHGQIQVFDYHLKNKCEQGNRKQSAKHTEDYGQTHQGQGTTRGAECLGKMVQGNFIKSPQAQGTRLNAIGLSNLAQGHSASVQSLKGEGAKQGARQGAKQGARQGAKFGAVGLGKIVQGHLPQGQEARQGVRPGAVGLGKIVQGNLPEGQGGAKQGNRPGAVLGKLVQGLSALLPQGEGARHGAVGLSKTLQGNSAKHINQGQFYNSFTNQGLRGFDCPQNDELFSNPAGSLNLAQVSVKHLLTGSRKKYDLQGQKESKDKCGLRNVGQYQGKAEMKRNQPHRPLDIIRLPEPNRTIQKLQRKKFKPETKDSQNSYQTTEQELRAEIALLQSQKEGLISSRNQLRTVAKQEKAKLAARVAQLEADQRKLEEEFSKLKIFTNRLGFQRNLHFNECKQLRTNFDYLKRKVDQLQINNKRLAQQETVVRNALKSESQKKEQAYKVASRLAGVQKELVQFKSRSSKNIQQLLKQFQQKQSQLQKQKKDFEKYYKDSCPNRRTNCQKKFLELREQLNALHGEKQQSRRVIVESKEKEAMISEMYNLTKARLGEKEDSVAELEVRLQQESQKNYSKIFSLEKAVRQLQRQVVFKDEQINSKLKFQFDKINQCKQLSNQLERCRLEETRSAQELYEMKELVKQYKKDVDSLNSKRAVLQEQLCKSKEEKAREFSFLNKNLLEKSGEVMMLQQKNESLQKQFSLMLERGKRNESSLVSELQGKLSAASTELKRTISEINLLRFQFNKNKEQLEWLRAKNSQLQQVVEKYRNTIKNAKSKMNGLGSKKDSRRQDEAIGRGMMLVEQSKQLAQE